MKAVETLQLFYDDVDKVVKILSTLESEEKDSLIQCLKENVDIFAWSAAYMLTMDPQVIVHKLNVLLKAKPMKQKRRRFVPQVVEAIRLEVGKLLSAEFIREVEYPD